MIGALLMAAGRSRRFKEETGTHKLSYSIHHRDSGRSRSLLAHSYDQLRTVFPAEQIFIITNNAEPNILKIAQNLQNHVINIDSEGLGMSIAKGLTKIAMLYPEIWQRWQGVLIAHADMPFIQQTTLQQLEAYLLKPQNNHATVRPCYHHSAGHPVGFHRDCFPELQQLTGDNGGKDILKKYPPKLLKTDDIGTIWDIDQQHDLTQSPQ